MIVEVQGMGFWTRGGSQGFDRGLAAGEAIRRNALNPNLNTNAEDNTLAYATA